MKILVITNLFPPHHAGTYDLRCESAVAHLRSRGHELRVLTSNHGLRAEQRGTEVERRLHLNGAFGHEPVSHVMDLKDLEFHNNKMVLESIGEFRPNLVYVWTLTGISMSVLFTLGQRDIPVAFDVDGRWLAEELVEDPWLNFWNRDQLPFKERALRASLEISGHRDRWDEQAPTRATRDSKRLPGVFGFSGKPRLNSITVFPLRHVRFVCEHLKQATLNAGFAIENAEVIPPSVEMNGIKSTPRTSPDTANRLLVYLPLRHGCGAMTALRALEALREEAPETRLTIAGQGDGDYVAKLRSHVVQHELPVDFELLSDTVTEMSAIFARHDLFLHTMESDQDFTMVPIQAAASGLPVVVTRHGTVGEYFRHGENCIQFAPGDPADLAARIRELQTRPDLRDYLASQSQREVSAQFAAKVVMDRTEAFLQRAAAPGMG